LPVIAVHWRVRVAGGGSAADVFRTVFLAIGAVLRTL
jgi:hypothetical protein